MPIEFYANPFDRSSNGGGTIQSYTSLTDKPSINGNTLVGDKTASELGLLDATAIGRGLQIGFDGTLANNVITFEPPSTSGIYEIKQDYLYEVDLNLPLVGDVDDSVEIVIKNGTETIQFVTPTHRASNTSVTFGQLKQLMRYNEESGYRWLFEARCKVTSGGVKVLLVYPVIINFADIPEDVMLPITNQEMLDAESDENPLYRGREIVEGDIFVCIDDNGYKAGHTYRWTAITGAEWEDCETHRATVSNLTATEITLDMAKANTDYYYGTLTSLTIQSNETSNMETTFSFKTGETFTASLPVSLKKVGTLEFSTNTEYVMAIFNNIAIIGEVN